MLDEYGSVCASSCIGALRPGASPNRGAEFTGQELNCRTMVVNPANRFARSRKQDAKIP